MIEINTPLNQLTEIEAQLGFSVTVTRRLAGGEQEGAWLVAAGDDQLVLKLQPDPARADRLLRAAPVMASAVAHGWPAAAWLHSGRLRDGTAFLLQEYVDGTPVMTLDLPVMRAILGANRRQAGLGVPEAVDDSGQLEAVSTGDHPWREAVRARSGQGAELVGEGDAVIRQLGPTPLPGSDLVHGDYSSTNLIMTPAGQIRFVDCETIGRGTRVRDLADLYRQCVVYPGTSPDVMELLREHACAIAGPAVFLRCFIAVTYNNLAWWVEHRSRADFDAACRLLAGRFQATLSRG